MYETMLDVPHGTTIDVPEHPCRTCGVATTGTAEDIQVPDWSRKNTRGEPLMVRISLATCDACTARAAVARAIVDAHSDVVARGGLGSRDNAAARFARALIVFDALRQTIPEPADWSPASILSALDWMEERAADASWSSSRDAARPDASSPTPWAFLDPDTRGRLRQHYAGWLVDQQPPRPIAHPTGSGCAACGVGAHLGRRVSEWQMLTSGKRRGLYLCATCSAQNYGGVSEEVLMNRIVLNVLDPTGRHRARRFDVPTFKGLRMWADSGRAKPSRKPWAHVDLSQARDAVESGRA